jgi:hypothetical protein
MKHKPVLHLIFLKIGGLKIRLEKSNRSNKKTKKFHMLITKQNAKQKFLDLLKQLRNCKKLKN